MNRHADQSDDLKDILHPLSSRPTHMYACISNMYACISNMYACISNTENTM